MVLLWKNNLMVRSCFDKIKLNKSLENCGIMHVLSPSLRRKGRSVYLYINKINKSKENTKKIHLLLI